MSRSFGATRFTTLPPMTISPSVISSRPAIIRKSVDLPHPDGPTSTQNSPSAIATSTPRITCVVPNHFSTAAIVTAAMGIVYSVFLTRSDDHGIIRAPAGEPAHDILRGFAPKLALGLHRVERRMRRQDHARMGNERRIARDRLGRQYV